LVPRPSVVASARSPACGSSSSQPRNRYWCRQHPLPALSIHLGRTKTAGADDDQVVYLTGRPVDALNAWLQAAKIDKGSIFRAIDRWGNVSRRTLDPKSVDDIVKHRAALAGLEAGGTFRAIKASMGLAG
jgi:hypothetical protein